MKRNDCTINDNWTYNGMKVVFMENEFLKIGILVDRGSDIFHFEFKPLQKNLLLKLDKDIHNPNVVFSQMRNTNNQFEDYYYGGWQEILPNTAPMNLRGAELGQHGEVSLIPWKYAIVQDSPEEVSLKVWTRPLRMPLLIEKTLTIKKGESNLIIDEKLTNESNTSLAFMWGHHIAFGLELLGNGGRIETSATQFEAEILMPDHRLFKPGIKQDWPKVLDINENLVDGNTILPSSKHFSDLGYLSEFEGRAFYRIHTDEMEFSVHWDKVIFKSLWYWQERYASQDSPWWGNAFAIALEPWSAKWLPDPSAQEMKDNWLNIPENGSISTTLTTNCRLK
ncbi:DUF4432 family protein [Portibacter lacus]|uniref:DUF4432 domain-containing protein n=1 Tax=Portibacter lacus TaxID=1099794 RepID=A0AA37SSA3_9BACT|nr:DUF4432 family protein [Portibacter lacus]GLR18729.1 hypothetical protein GCM10007940_33450 [Portibacter lacus]